MKVKKQSMYLQGIRLFLKIKLTILTKKIKYLLSGGFFLLEKRRSLQSPSKPYKLIIPQTQYQHPDF